MGAEIKEPDPPSPKQRLEDSFPIAGCWPGPAGRRKAAESEQSERFVDGNSAVRSRGLPRPDQIEGCPECRALAPSNEARNYQ